MDFHTNLNVQDVVYFCELDRISKIEQWKDISDYFGLYQISDLGRVKSLKEIRFMVVNNSYAVYKERILRPSITEDGYLKITLTKSVKRTFLVHRLVGEFFVDNPENKPQINHKFQPKTNNTKYNIEWNSCSENIQHAYDNGLKTPVSGIKNGSSKLTEKEVLEIRLIGSSKLKKDIAKMYNVGTSTISRVLNKQSWSHI